MPKLSAEIKAADRKKDAKELSAGDLFAKLFRAKDQPRDILCDTLGITLSEHTNWTKSIANGRCRINAHKLHDIAKGLELDEKDKTDLIHTRLPAMNKEWLAQQPCQVRGGWLMEAYRELVGLPQEALVDTFDVREPISISQRERGILKFSLDEEGIAALADKLSVPSEERNYFAQQIQASDRDIAQQTRVKRGQTTLLDSHTATAALGGVFSARRSPVLASAIDEQLGRHRRP